MSHVLKDTESLPWNEPEQIGFAALSDFLASDPDRALSFFKSFHRSSIEDLLYLEAELSELNADIEWHTRQDLLGSIEDRQCARSWKRLAASTDPRQRQKKELILQRRALNREYREALTLDKMILSMQHPHHNTVEATRRWSAREDLDESIRTHVLNGRSAHRLDDDSDLVTTRNAVDQDRMLRFVRKYLGIFFLSGPLEGDLARISEKRIARAVSVLSTIIAAILLIGAVVNLYLVANNNVRLILIAVYTTVFASTVGLLTSASRAEVYASTAAYAACLVVFVSGNLGSPQSGF